MKLYHYTTIETLALILKNKTIRFNNLMNVDDQSEADTEDKGSYKNYIFVSCWTKDCNESIPLWKMYSNNCKGIRIGFDSDHIQFKSQIGDNEMYFIVKNVKSPLQNAYFLKIDKQPIKIEYDNSQRIMESTVNSISKRIALDELYGKKKKYWSFQKEYRFILLGYNYYEIDPSILDFPAYILQKIIDKEEDFNCPYVDLVLDNAAFSKMEVLTGPACTTGELEIVNSLINSFSNSSNIDCNIKI